MIFVDILFRKRRGKFPLYTGLKTTGCKFGTAWTGSTERGSINSAEFKVGLLYDTKVYVSY